MKKKMLSIVTGMLAGLMCVTPVFAANTGKGHTDLSLYVPNDPTYTITIPETVTLDAKEHTQVEITASDVTNIPEGKKISVTFQKGNGTYGRLYMVGDKMNGAKPYMMTLNMKSIHAPRIIRKKKAKTVTLPSKKEFIIRHTLITVLP